VFLMLRPGMLLHPLNVKCTRCSRVSSCVSAKVGDTLPGLQDRRGCVGVLKPVDYRP
jgi:hypothetical protein